MHGCHPALLSPDIVTSQWQSCDDDDYDDDDDDDGDAIVVWEEAGAAVTSSRVFLFCFFVKFVRQNRSPELTGEILQKPPKGRGEEQDSPKLHFSASGACF